MYLSNVLDDYSRYIIAWESKTAKGQPMHDDEGRRCDRDARHGAGSLWLRTGPCQAQTQGKIERQKQMGHQTLKNRVLLENYFLPGDLEAKIEAFVERYNQATTRASTMSHRPMLTSAEQQPSSSEEKGSTDKHLNKGACFTASSPPKSHQPDEAKHSLSQNFSMSQFI